MKYFAALILYIAFCFFLGLGIVNVAVALSH